MFSEDNFFDFYNIESFFLKIRRSNNKEGELNIEKYIYPADIIFISNNYLLYTEARVKGFQTNYYDKAEECVSGRKVKILSSLKNAY